MPFNSVSAGKLARAVGRVQFDTLEGRRMLCSLTHEPNQHVDEQFFNGDPVQEGGAANIVWTNRGGLAANGGNGTDNDRFGSVFGANAENARLVIDAVIRHFERMVGSFNYSDGSTNFNLTVSMATTGTSAGASASLGATLNGKPKSGSVSMGRGSDTTGDGLGDGGNWFIDTTPDDNSEFVGSIGHNRCFAQRFAGDIQRGSADRRRRHRRAPRRR